MIILQDATFHLISKKSISVKVLKKFHNNLVEQLIHLLKRILPNAVFFSLQNLTLLIVLMKKVNKIFFLQ